MITERQPICTVHRGRGKEERPIPYTLVISLSVVIINMDQNVIKKIAKLLTAAKRPLFITGAGISAESGLPTYRGISGLYNSGLTAEGIPIEDAISGEMWKRNPSICWKYIYQIGAACFEKTYNAAHEFIAQVEEEKPDTWVLTQNIDGYHKSAGSKNVIEIHGHLRSQLCNVCDTEWWGSMYLSSPLLDMPRCPECDSLLRPNVVLFGEQLQDKACDTYQIEMMKGFDIVFSIGTTSIFPYIAQPIHDATEKFIPTVEINPGRTDVTDHVAFKLECGAVEAFEEIKKYL